MDDLERYQRRRAVRQKALRKLGATNVRCLCGQSDPVCFEADHIYRRMHDGTCWGLCKNCHARKSAREQSEHPPVGQHPGDPFERIAHALLGMQMYDTFNAERLGEMADFMLKLAGKGIEIED